MNFQKKERNIKDEVLASQGGTVASRFSRFEPRKKAVDEINQKFGGLILDDGTPVLPNGKIEVEYYDGLRTTLEQEESDFIEEGAEDDGYSNE